MSVRDWSCTQCHRRRALGYCHWLKPSQGDRKLHRGGSRRNASSTPWGEARNTAPKPWIANSEGRHSRKRSEADSAYNKSEAPDIPPPRPVREDTSDSGPQRHDESLASPPRHSPSLSPESQRFNPLRQDSNSAPLTDDEQIIPKPKAIKGQGALQGERLRLPGFVQAAKTWNHESETDSTSLSELNRISPPYSNIGGSTFSFRRNIRSSTRDNDRSWREDPLTNLIIAFERYIVLVGFALHSSLTLFAGKGLWKLFKLKFSNIGLMQQIHKRLEPRLPPGKKRIRWICVSFHLHVIFRTVCQD